MVNRVFFLIKHLESDLVKFYQKLCNVPKLKSFYPIFMFMINQSSAHERRVEKLSKFFEENDIPEEPILKIHDHVKHVLYNKVIHEENSQDVIELIAEAEEIIGMTYEKIAIELRKKATQYNKMATILEKLEKEEYIHRDILLGKKKVQDHE